MMALVMATAQGPQVVSVIAKFLGNGSTIRDASAASGSDACAKISAQAAAIGGFGQVSAQGFTSGSITCTSGTVNVPAGVEVVLGANSITASACPAFLLHSNSTLRGQSFNDGTLTNIAVANCPYNGIVSVAPASTSVKIADLQTTGGGYYDSSGTAHGGGWQAGSIGDDICQVTVSSSSVVTCPAPAGNQSGSDMVTDPSIPWTFGGSSNAVYNQHTEGFGSIGYLGDFSGVAVTAVSTSGGMATFTGASAFPQYAYPATLFTPNCTNQSSASFLSFQQPAGNYFKGGTPLNGIPVNTDGLKFYDWVLHDAAGHVYGTPLTASKLEVCAP